MSNTGSTPDLPPTEREAFETWARDKHWSVRRRPEPAGDFYSDQRTQEGWFGWQGRAALSNHEDGGRAEPVWCSCGDAIMPDTGAKCGVCASGVALGGEKGEAVAETENALRPDHPLAKGSCVHGESMAKHCAWCSARPVGKARMLTDLEITRCWEATFGYLELGIAIQHKFCEKNGIEVLS